MTSEERQPLNNTANESFERTMAYCYECLTDLHPHYNCVECAGCGFLLCADGCTLCHCEVMKGRA